MPCGANFLEEGSEKEEEEEETGLRVVERKLFEVVSGDGRDSGGDSVV